MNDPYVARPEREVQVRVEKRKLEFAKVFEIRICFNFIK